MKYVLSALGFGLLAIISVACQPPTVSQPGGVPVAVGPPRAVVPQICQNKGIMSSTDFVSKRAFFLSAGSNFDPRLGNPPSGPSIDGTNPFATDLAAAFDAAPPSLQAMLCDRDYNVFIVQNSCSPGGCTADDVIGNSWGFRQQTAPPKRYIATSAVLWQNGSLPTFGVYESNRLPAALHRLASNVTNWPKPPPQYSQPSPNDPVTSLLAVLADEAGHVLWYDAFVASPGGPFTGSVAGIFIYALRRTVHGVTLMSHRSLASRRDGLILATVYRPKSTTPIMRERFGVKYWEVNLGQREIPCRTQSKIRVSQACWQRYSPVEDFVEAYELYVLTNARSPLTDLTIQVPGHAGYNIPGGLAGPGKGQLRAKMACLTQYIRAQSWPLP